jgi:hypothetical protein
MSKADDFVGIGTPKRADLQALTNAGAKEISDGIWRFDDESCVRAVPSVGLNNPSGFLVNVVDCPEAKD